MDVLVWKCSWQHSEDLARKIVELLPARDVICHPNTDPMRVTIRHGDGQDLRIIRDEAGVMVGRE